MKHIAISENHLYSKTYAKGEKFVGRHIIVYVMKDFKARKFMNANPSKEYVNRVGMTVSKKIGCAVIRNRAKRIMREGLRQVEKELNIKKGYLIVLVARTSVVEAKTRNISDDLRSAFSALNFINDENNT